MVEPIGYVEPEPDEFEGDAVSGDLETFLITPGNLTPPPVCGSFADAGGSWLEPADQALETFGRIFRERKILDGANISFDLAIVGAFRLDLLPEIFEHLERGLVHDVQHSIALDAIAKGILYKDPNTGGPLRVMKHDGSWGKVTKRYSLETCVRLILGRNNAKENDEYRLRYGELAALPISAWPEKARTYPIDDANNTREVAQEQRRRALSGDYENQGPIFRWIPRTQSAEPLGWSHLTHQTRAAFAMQLAAVWGIRADPAAVEALAADMVREHERTEGQLRAANLLKLEGDEWKENGSAVKARVAIAYGTDPNSKCSNCNGTGKVKSAKTKNLIQCKTCSATGLEIAPTVPRTPADGIKADRDTLLESHDEVLEGLAERDAKVLDTYVPFLRNAARAPAIISPNVILETARASWGILQTLPKFVFIHDANDRLVKRPEGGVRECIVAPEGWVLVSVDYNALEFATLGQVALWVVGYSRIAEAINAGKDAHSILGARMTSIEYAAFKAQVDAKAEFYKLIRQGSKAGNFGFGGLMGPVKFAITQRRAKVGGDHGSMCRLMGREVHPCGSVKITTWKKRPVPPVCDQCAEVSAELKAGWLDTWPEMNDYFEWISSIPGIDEGEGQILSPGTGFVRGKLNASQAANHCFQHLAAMGAKHALWNVSRECYTDKRSALYGSKPIVFAHDEILALLPESQAHDAAMRLAEIMRDPELGMRKFVPDVAINCEPALMRRWYKAADPVYDANGKLIPWEPKKKGQ
jgi:hypothetical protein